MTSPARSPALSAAERTYTLEIFNPRAPLALTIGSSSVPRGPPFDGNSEDAPGPGVTVGAAGAGREFGEASGGGVEGYEGFVPPGVPTSPLMVANGANVDSG